MSKKKHREKTTSNRNNMNNGMNMRNKSSTVIKYVWRKYGHEQVRKHIIFNE